MDDFDPNLKGMTTEELYRMLQILDDLKNKKMERVSSRDLKKLEMLMALYGVPNAN